MSLDSSSVDSEIAQHALTPAIGSAIQLDKQQLLSGVHARALRVTLQDRGVLVFRGIALSDAEQVQFAKTLGPVVEEGKDHIYKITMDPAENASAEYLKGSFFWHIDGTMQRTPIFASLLSCRRRSSSGGQTEFCNSYAAYEALPAELKSRIETLHAVHSQEAAQRFVNPEPSYAELQAWRKWATPARLPLVWTHRSGRKSLLVGATAGYVEGLSWEDSGELPCRLRDHATQPQFTYRHEWRVGDLVIWDNTGTMHRAIAYPLDSGRMMHRTKLQGFEAFHPLTN